MDPWWLPVRARGDLAGGGEQYLHGFIADGNLYVSIRIQALAQANGWKHFPTK